jgi:hypothetical protein
MMIDNHNRRFIQSKMGSAAAGERRKAVIYYVSFRPSDGDAAARRPYQRIIPLE